MTYFPRTSRQRNPGVAKPGVLRDVLWGRPVFKAPHLPNPRAAFDPLPFTATRITRRDGAK